MVFYTALLTATKNRQMEDYGAVEVRSGAAVKEGLDHWQGIFRQLVVLNYLRKEVETYGVLHLTDKGMAFLSNPQPLMLAKQRDFSETDAGDSLVQTRGSAGGVLDPKLRDLLTVLRKEVSAEKELPPYVIFQDVSLDEMATHYPTTPDELLRITGWVRARPPSTALLSWRLIAEHVEAKALRSRGHARSEQRRQVQAQSHHHPIARPQAGPRRHRRRHPGNRDMVLDEIEKIVAQAPS